LKAFLTGFDPNLKAKQLKKFLKSVFKGITHIEIPRNFSSGCVFLYFQEKYFYDECLKTDVFLLNEREISVKRALSGAELDQY
jgi:hypothetical protein